MKSRFLAYLQLLPKEVLFVIMMILKITNGLNGYPRFGWVDIVRFQQSYAM